MSAVIQIDNILSEYESAVRTDDPEEALSDLLTVQPKYDISKRCPRCLTQEIKDEIGFCLKKNAIKIATGLRKQRMLKKDIHQFLLSRGYTAGEKKKCLNNAIFHPISLLENWHSQTADWSLGVLGYNIEDNNNTSVLVFISVS